jgi:UDP-N-acetylmuramoyl-L-alanyl-D-glutamate--2,6-diaminopimelate ligase
MNRYEVSSVSIIGIGGSGAFYIAKFLLLCGVDVYGWDIKENERTKELENLGVNITYSNPEKPFDTEYFIYTHNMPEKLIKKYKVINNHIDSYEVGKVYKNIINDYEDDLLSESQQKAFKESDIAPLYNLDLGDIRLIGITGTDGKTTTCSMIYHILKNNGFKPALISTVSAIVGDEEIDTGFHTTTPTSQELYKLIKKAVSAKCTHIILETTSHGLEQGRIAGIKFDSIGYTNVTKEHLDYHKTYENYLESKGLLIKDHTKPDSIVVLNMDDNSYEYLNGLTLGRSMEYSIKNSNADLYATNIVVDHDINFKLHSNSGSVKVTLPIFGLYNVSNFLLASGICLNENIDIGNIEYSIKNFKTVKGRMELIQDTPFKVFIDFAHTPNATLQALQSVIEITKGKVIHVFGCAGLRDPFKRYEMGKISNQFADITILTAEDPRSESLKEINDEIERGYKEGGNVGELIRFDYDDRDVEVRRDAIKEAISLAKTGDTVIITGKAHEQSLCFGDTEYDWNDIDETKSLLTALHKS